MYNTYKTLFSNISNYIYILKGLVVTIEVSMGCFLFGLIFGIVFGLLIYFSKINEQKIFFRIIKFIQSFFIKTPIISQIFISYFVFSLSSNLVLLSIIILGVNSAAHISVKVVEYLNNLSSVYWETAYTLGLTPLESFVQIFLKEMFYVCRQNFFGELIALVKESALLSFFGVKDICYRSKEIGAGIYNLAPYILFASCIYFFLITILEFIYNKYLDKKDT